MRSLKFRYTFKRKVDSHIYQITTSIIGIEEGARHLKSMLDNDFWELITRDEYTGLKDKNSAEIYENDWCKSIAYYYTSADPEAEPESKEYEGVIAFIEGAFMIKPKCGNPLPLHYYDQTIEVIGNIHDKEKTK